MVETRHYPNPKSDTPLVQCTVKCHHISTACTWRVCVIDRDYSLPGSYRKIVMKPEELSWEILYYNDVQLPLIQGDLDVLHNQPLTHCSEGWCNSFP